MKRKETEKKRNNLENSSFAKSVTLHMYSTMIHAHLKSDAELAEIASKYEDVDFRPY